MTYNEIMQKSGKRIHPKVYYNDDNIKTEYEYDDIVLAKPFFNAKLLGTIMKGFSCTLKHELPNKPIYFSNTARYNGISATKTYGPYYLKEKNYNADSKEYEHELYDDFISTMVDYEPITITYPCTVLEFFKRLCVECGFTTNINSLPNGSKIMIKDIYEDINFTFRDVFDDIGQATASLFKVHNKNVERCKFGTKKNVINDDILKNQNIQLGKHYGPIDSIVLKRSGDTDSIYKRDETKTSWCELIIKDNQLMNNNDRSEYLNNLYNELHGIEFDLFDLELVGFGGFEPLDKIEIQTGDKIYNSFIFNNEMEFTQGFKEVIYNEKEESESSDYKVMDKTDRRINQTYIIADKLQQLIEATIINVEGNTERITQILQNISEILMSVQQSGGNNLIKNSVGFAGTTEWDLAYDNVETSVVNTISNVELLQNGTSGGAFQLNGVKITQNIVVNSKDTYTFNCKVQKRAGFSGYIKVYNANDLTQSWERKLANEEELNFEDITFENIKINGNSLIVEFYGVEGSNLTITDSMLNLGDLSSVWTQANGEILNTQVNINMNGVMVKSIQFDENGQYVVMSPLEFAGYAKKNGVSVRVFTVNGDTTEVENLYIKNMMKIPPIKFVPNKTGNNRGVATVADWSGIQ